ncbi:hypothetical protein RHMOL_Rhmol01G0309700 [Rhododendron molle]|uniref:Uncharacterized protein n=1 Tax=Rhododendron molle TaxID=49168 RepID=A0ACC0QAW8_RHOML|nr:hypothetical protein RHMOL_Rhmol01G0309700 [Rhododendron molle]
MDCLQIVTRRTKKKNDLSSFRPMDCSQIATVDEDGAVPRLSAASSSSQRRANDMRVFTFGELKAATGGFSRGMMIGKGEFGCVYRGVVRVSDFDDGNCSGSNMDVAVKQLNRNGFQARLLFPVPLSMYVCVYEQGHKEWINEVNFLGVVKHPNLVKLVGHCAEDDERGIQRLLVYELMHNKSLKDHLFNQELSPLSWMARLRIAQDAARGLAHLHEEMDFPIILRDLKTSNILLDENFNAKLSDFGLARQGPTAGLSHVSTSVVCPTHYAAPEYIETGRLTARSDVWSFGVVLYELITGRRAVLHWVRPYVSDSRKIPPIVVDPREFHRIVDPRLKGHYCIKSAQNLAALANKCLAKNAKSRPKMSEVVEMLGKIISETSSKNDSAPQHAKETQGSEVVEMLGKIISETSSEMILLPNMPKKLKANKLKAVRWLRC